MCPLFLGSTGEVVFSVFQRQDEFGCAGYVCGCVTLLVYQCVLHLESLSATHTGADTKSGTECSCSNLWVGWSGQTERGLVCNQCCTKTC